MSSAAEKASVSIAGIAGRSNALAVAGPDAGNILTGCTAMNVKRRAMNNKKETGYAKPER